MIRRKKLFLIGPLAMLAVFALMAAGSEIVLLLWNWLLPPLFGFHQITFWQAFGILVLSRILFGGFGLHRSGGPRFRDRMGDRFDWLTPEEREQMRERFRQRMRERWGFGPSTQQPAGQ